MALLFLAGDFPPAFGGIQKLNHGLCSALVRAGGEVCVLAGAQPGDAAFDATSAVPTVRFGRGARLLKVTALARALRRRLASGPPPQAVIATNWQPEGLAYVLTGGRRPPMVLMGYGREFLPEAHRRVRAMAQRAVLRAAAGAVVISRYTAAQMVSAGMSPDRVRIVPPGVDHDEFPAPDDPELARREAGLPAGPVLLTIARLVRRKGIDTVIEALPLVAKQVPNVQYAVIGGGPDRERLLELARSLGVSDRVHLLGSRSEAQKAACLHVCELLAMPSRDIPSEPPEGFGIVYLEANLCGKPVIAARTGGVADAVEDGVNGLLVEPDRPDQVAEAAARLLSNPAEAAALGERGRRRACERFSWTAIAPQFRRAVTELTGA